MIAWLCEIGTALHDGVQAAVVAVDPPNPPPEAPPGLEEAANTFLGWLKWGAIVAGVVGLTICGLMMMVGRRNRSYLAVDGAQGIPWVLIGLSLTSLAAGIVGAVMGG